MELSQSLQELISKNGILPVDLDLTYQDIEIQKKETRELNYSSPKDIAEQEQYARAKQMIKFYQYNN